MREKLVLLVVVAAVALLGVAVIHAATLTVEEADLNPSGSVYDVNRGPNGDVYVSDYALDQVWHVVSSGAYTLYQDIPTATDARPDGSGDIWWTDSARTFGRIDVAGDTVTTWTFPGDTYLWGLAFDDAGRVWLTQYYDSQVYRFDPQTTDLCTYTVGAPSDYVLFRGGYVWLANWGNDRIYRLDPALNQFASWAIPGSGPRPFALALDPAGNLWWTDSGLDALARLEPGSDRMTVFSLDANSNPRMLTVRDGEVWYTQALSHAVGVLDPAVAAGAVHTPTRITGSLAPVCHSLGDGTTVAVSKLTGTLSWVAGTLSPTYPAAGRVVYELPAGADPRGIAGSGAWVWVGDEGRGKLVRLVSVAPPVVAVHLEKRTNGQDADAPPGPAIPVGQDVTWTYAVSNPGDVDLTGVTLRDDRGTPADPGDDYTCVVGTLPAGAFDATSCMLAGTARAGQYANLATVEGTYGITRVNAVDASHYFGVSTGIALEKRTNGQDADDPPGPSIPVGQVVTWTYAVTNTGNVALDGVTVVDDRGTPADPGDDYTCVIGSLAAGATGGATCLLTATATAGPYQNTATVQATGGEGLVSAVDLGHYVGVRVGVDLEKRTNGQDADTAPGPEIPVGAPVTWTYVVTNTGDVELAGLTVVDDNGTPADASDDFVCALGTLAAGASDGTTCVQVGVAVEGPYRNLATVEGSYEGVGVRDSDAGHYVGTGRTHVYLPLVLRTYGP